MPSDDSTVIIEIAADVEQLKSQFKKIEEQAESSGKQVQKSLSKGVDENLTRGLNNLKREILSIGAAVAGAFAFRKMIAEAVGAEDAVNELNGAMRAAGLNVAQASLRFQEYAAGLQNITTVSDDAIISSAAMLVSVGRLSGDGLEKATKAALDLSAGLNISLESAMDRVAKAANGNTMAFDKMGFNISKTGSDASKFSQTLEQIEQRFGGLAENKVNTFGGALAQLSNRFNDVLETLGKMITQSPVVIALVKALGDVFLNMNKSIEGIAGSGDVVGNLIKTFLEFGQTVITYVVAPLELLYNIGVITFNTLKVAGQSLLVLFLDIGNVIFQALIYPMQKLSEFGANFAGFVSKDLGNSFTAAAAGFKGMRDASQMATESARETLDQFGNDLENSNQKIFNFDASTRASEFVSKVQAVAAAAVPAVTDASTQIAMAAGEPIVTLENSWGMALDGISAKFAELRQNAVANMQSMGAAAVTSIGQGVGGAFAAMGKAMVTGKNGLKAFADAMLASLGQAAVQAGTNFILTGAAYTWAGMPNGPPLMAAGAALAAFGGILSGLGGGAAAGGGGVAASGGSLSSGDSMMTKPAEKEVKSTDVQVVVQGNILDRRETGLHIVETLNEYFNTSDGRITRGSFA